MVMVAAKFDKNLRNQRPIVEGWDVTNSSHFTL